MEKLNLLFAFTIFKDSSVYLVEAVKCVSTRFRSGGVKPVALLYAGDVIRRIQKRI